MEKRRVLIIALFVLIGVFAVYRTVLQSPYGQNEMAGEEQIYPLQGNGDTGNQPFQEEILRFCSRLLDKLLLLTVTVPFLITVILLARNAGLFE